MADELKLNRIDVLRLLPGDLLIIDCGTSDPDEVQQIAEAVNNALEYAGVADTVSALLHEGNIKIEHIRVVRSA